MLSLAASSVSAILIHERLPLERTSHSRGAGSDDCPITLVISSVESLRELGGRETEHGVVLVTIYSTNVLVDSLDD